jgi:hypothetical protein
MTSSGGFNRAGFNRLRFNAGIILVLAEDDRRPDPTRTTARRLGPARSTAVRRGPDPTLSTGTR